MVSSSSELLRKILIMASTAVLVFQIASLSREENKYLDLIRGSLPGNDKRVIEILKGRYLDSPSALPYNLSTDPEYNKHSRSASWNYINHYLKEFFSNQTKGFFVEAGALDGEFLSNSLWLEQSLGWQGLLIEPDRESYLQLLKKHRRSWSSNTCLSITAYPKETVHMAVKLNSRYYGVKWFYRGASHEVGVTVAPHYNSFFEVSDSYFLPVQCFPLASYLQALDITKVDFLSLDIQGSEKGVLESFPWREIIIRLIIVEFSRENRDIIKFLESLGYEWLNPIETNVIEDFIFVRREDLKGIDIKCYNNTHY